MNDIPNLTNLLEWNRFAEKRITVIEMLTILNNRHREMVKIAHDALHNIANAHSHTTDGEMRDIAKTAISKINQPTS